MSLWAAFEIPTANDATESPALGGTDHLDRFSNFKYVGFEFLSHFEFREVAHAELLQVREPAARPALMSGFR